MNKPNDETLLDFSVLLKSVSGICISEKKSNIFFSSVATDSRLVEKNSLFVPLIGENQNGHKYIPSAIEKGASIIFVEQAEYEAKKAEYDALSLASAAVFVIVKNNLYALQAAAAAYVNRFQNLIKVGVTGSSGKTTTKELLVALLSQKYCVIANEGNLNSETGLPLSVFKIRKEHEVGVFEMGMNRVGEIGELSRVLRPKYAVITNIGTAHIGILGSRQNIAIEKKQIFSNFTGNETAFVPQNDDFADFLCENVQGKVEKYGSDDSEIQFGEDCGLAGVRFFVRGVEMTLSLPGIYNYRNACAAVRVALDLGVSPKQIKAGIEGIKPIFGRSQVLFGTYTIVQDCYNANPDSMEKSVDFFASVKSPKKKIFVLGDMLELGAESEAEHSRVGTLIAQKKADLVIFIGNEMRYAFESAKKSAPNANLLYFAGKDDGIIAEAAAAIKNFANDGDLILLKASRGIGLERLTKLLTGS